MSDKPYFCIYHGNCADGFGAAWVVRKALGEENVEFYPGKYQKEPPDVTGKIVILVDFSYKRPVMTQMAAKARGILVLDHHKSAQEELRAEEGDSFKDFGSWPGDNWSRFLSNVEMDTDKNRPTARVYTIFDMERSGAGLTWDFFFPRKPRPRLIAYIEDRDLWRFRLVKTREVQANLFSFPYDFEVWDRLMVEADTFGGLNRMIQDGEAIERKNSKDLRELLKVTTRWMMIDGALVPVANLPYTMASDGCSILLEEYPHAPFAAFYYDTPTGRVFSLRSREGGWDVSEVAKRYGGGGHKHAAGFEVPFDRLKEPRI